MLVYIILISDIIADPQQDSYATANICNIILVSLLHKKTSADIIAFFCLLKFFIFYSNFVTVQYLHSYESKCI